MLWNSSPNLVQFDLNCSIKHRKVNELRLISRNCVINFDLKIQKKKYFSTCSRVVRIAYHTVNLMQNEFFFRSSWCETTTISTRTPNNNKTEERIIQFQFEEVYVQIINFSFAHLIDQVLSTTSILNEFTLSAIYVLNSFHLFHVTSHTTKTNEYSLKQTRNIRKQTNNSSQKLKRKIILLLCLLLAAVAAASSLFYDFVGKSQRLV